MPSIIEKQAEIIERFKKMKAREQLQHAYIFDGLAGVGKYDLAIWVSQMLYCKRPKVDGAPCLECNQCQRIAAGEHPDVVTLKADGASIKVRQVRQIKEEFSKSGVESRKKILIVEEMEKMTVSAANSLLKFIEEPEGQILIMLLTEEIQKLLPTITSRCQIIHFKRMNVKDRVASIEDKGIARESATILAYLTQDSQVAEEIHSDEDFQEILQTVWQWFVLVNKNKDQAFIYVHTNIMPLVQSSKESKLILDLLLILYRDLMTLSFNQERLLAFSKYESQLEQLARVSNPENISHNLALILNAEKKLSTYVAAQGLFEQIALNIKN